MIEQGLLDEVESLLAEPKPLSQQARAAIGYATTAISARESAYPPFRSL